MTNPDRLTGLDASFLALEDAGAHMHVGSCLLFEGRAPGYNAFVAQLDSRLHLVPRYRQKLAFPPLTQARPVWIDDPHFNPGYHVRHTALPAPASLEQLRNVTGRVLAQRLDRTKPLWEIWLVDEVEGGRFAMITKTHHCLVDGVSGVDIATVLFDVEAEPAPPPEPTRRRGSPGPSRARRRWWPTRWPSALSTPIDAARAAADAFAHPEKAAGRLGKATYGLGAMLRAGLQGAPPSPYNVTIGPHRRFAWADGDLAQFKAIKDALGGSVNDVVLAAVTGALRTHMQANGHEVDGIELKAMVPVSIRAEAERGALGNRVTSMFAPLPVYADDPVERFEIVHEAMQGLKESGQAVGAEMLTQLAGFAPPTVLSQASRLQSSQRAFNVVVTNVPGPQFPLYMLGRRLLRIYPQVPLVRNTALGIAIMSYDGTLNFGLLGDYDALPDLDDLAAALRDAIAELAAAAGVAKKTRVRASAARSRRAADRRAVARGGDRRRAHAPVARRRRGRPAPAGRARRSRRAARTQPAGVTRDSRPLTEDQIRQATSLGNVVLRYSGSRPPAALRELQDELTGPVRRRDRRRGPGGDPGGRRQDGGGARLGPAAARAHARRSGAADVRRGVARRGRARSPAG